MPSRVVPGAGHPSVPDAGLGAVPVPGHDASGACGDHAQLVHAHQHRQMMPQTVHCPPVPCLWVTDVCGAEMHV